MVKVFCAAAICGAIVDYRTFMWICLGSAVLLTWTQDLFGLGGKK